MGMCEEDKVEVNVSCHWPGATINRDGITITPWINIGYSVHKGVELHPYGDTVAEETLVETDIKYVEFCNEPSSIEELEKFFIMTGLDPEEEWYKLSEKAIALAGIV